MSEFSLGNPVLDELPAAERRLVLLMSKKSSRWSGLGLGGVDLALLSRGVGLGLAAATLPEGCCCCRATTA